MEINKIKKEKKIDCSEFFGEGEFVTLKFIDREKWKYIGQLSLKSADSILFSAYNTQKILDLLKKNEKSVEKKSGSSDDTESISALTMIESVKEIPVDVLIEASKIGNMANRELIDSGLSKKNHSFTDDGKPIVLNFDTVCLLSGVKNKSGEAFYDWIITQIREFNRAFDMGEMIGNV